MKVDLFWIGGVEGRLAIMARPRGGEWLDGEIEFLRAQGIDTLVSLLTNAEVAELDLVDQALSCARQGIDFLRFPIEDRSTPSDSEGFRDFVDELVSRHRGGQSLAIHCRMGIGRSSLLAACVLDRVGVPAPDAFQQISKARGCAVPDTKVQRDWVVRFCNVQR